MIKGSHLKSRYFISLDEASTPVKFGSNCKVYFYDCHPDQPAWLKQLFLVCGVVRRAALDPDTQAVAYQVYIPTKLRSVFVYEKDLLANCSDDPISCPWGTVESAMKDGLMVKVDEGVEPEVLLEDVVKTLELDAVDYRKQKRRLHVILKTVKSVVRVSYDRHPEFRVFAKRASYADALEALQI